MTLALWDQTITFGLDLGPSPQDSALLTGPRTSGQVGIILKETLILLSVHSIKPTPDDLPLSPYINASSCYHHRQFFFAEFCD